MLRSVGPDEIRRRPDQGAPAGYAHPAYIQSLSEFGRPLHLPRAGAWLLARQIPGSSELDAIGAYPYFACADYAALSAELGHLRSLVSVGVVPDPFSFAAVSELQTAFGHVVPYKVQYLADLEIGFRHYLSAHHRRYVRKGLSNFDLECATNPAMHTAEWAAMYRHLVVRRQISGLQAFSPSSLAQQLAVPGCLYFRALREGAVHGAMVCYIDRGAAYAHLISTTPVGQALSVQYALYWTAIEHCRDLARWLVFGGVPGLSGEEHPGLSFFKAGWATATCQGYFCGHVIDPGRYEELCVRLHRAHSSFPAYRVNPLG